MNISRSGMTGLLLSMTGLAHAQLTIIGGAAGNGDFNAVATPSGAHTYAQTPSWFNAQGSEAENATESTLMGGSTDPGPVDRGGIPIDGRTQVNSTGYTIADSNQQFSISYVFGAGGGLAEYSGSAMSTWLFTVAPGDAVDADLTAGDMTELAGSRVTYTLGRASGDPQWTTFDRDFFYTTSAAEIGTTVYLGMEFDHPSGKLNARIDVINLEVTEDGIANGPPSFTADPISMPDADEDVVYTGSTLAGSATDPESDPLIFSKTAGPAWLQVAADGALTGTPGAADAGSTNSFTVQVISLGGSDTATLNIYVKPFQFIPNGWESFVLTNSLSGNMFADADSDTVPDVYEYAHGGNPTNPADTGILPHVVYGSNDVVSFISMETTHTNPGITYTAEWTDSLVTGEWSKIWNVTNYVPSAIPGYDEVERQITGGPEDTLFFRNRLFSPPRPNILFILADDLGYADVSFNHPWSGANEITTPELDNLATNGTIFTSAYVVHPFCGPSRMGLMSGTYPHEYGGPFNLNDATWRDEGIPADQTLFSTALQDAGYFTGIMGKWHLGWDSQFHPNNRGFDEFYGFLGGGQVYWGPYQSGGWDYLRYPEENGTQDTSLGYNDHITDVLTEKGSNFIVQASSTEDPFFLFMSYNAPHSVLVSGGRDQAKPEDLAFYSGVTDQYRRNYCGLVRGMDRCIGELVQTLKDTGQYENTLIVFLSDNGGREDQVGSGDNGVLRGAKGDTTEGGVRVPMFMHWPGVIPADAVYDHPVTALDFFPTFMNLAEATYAVQQDLDGVDIWDHVRNGTSARPGGSIYSVRYQVGSDQTFVGIRRDNWKALKWWTADWHLYNMDGDIGETSNVAWANATVLSNMVSDAEAWSDDHVRPLWFDSPSQESQWDSFGMPHYDTIFTPSLP